MTEYKGDSVDFKGGGGGGGGRRFALLMLFLLVGLLLIYALVSDPSPAGDELPMPTAVPTAVLPGMSVNVEQSAPAVRVESNVNVEQAPPYQPPPIVVDNTAALMAADSAREARLAADNALAAVNVLAPRVAALETRTAVVDDLSPALLRFEQQTARAAADIDLIIGGLLAVLVVLMLLATAVGWLTMRPPTLPRGYTIDQRPEHYDQNPPEPVRTVQNGSAVHLVEPLERFRTVQLEPARTDARTDAKLDPNVPMSRAERQQILYWWKMLNSYTAVAKLLYGSKNGNTFNRVKNIIEEVAHD